MKKYQLFCLMFMFTLLAGILYGCGEQVNVECMLQGKLTGNSYDKAYVLLCKTDAANDQEPAATIDSKMVAKPDDKGIYKFSGIPEGEYIVLYASEKDLSDDILKKIDKGRIYYTRPIAKMNQDGTLTQKNLDNLFDFEKPGFNVKFADQNNSFEVIINSSGPNVYLKDGSITSEFGGLTMEYLNKAPVTVKVEGSEKSNAIVYVTENK